MRIWDTLVDGATRLVMDGPIGALLGARPAPPGVHPGTQQIGFTIGVIALGAKMARVDGAVTSDEVEAFRSFFRVPEGEEGHVRRFFDLAKRDALGFEPYARQVAALFPDAPEILEDVLEGLIDIAQADGKLGEAEAAYLARVADIFGLDSARFERAKAAALGEASCEACAVLGVDPLASDDDIKQAWLRLVRANHPDRLIAQGLPDEAIALATRKLAAINAAYDRLRTQRADA
ncbi:MAG: molecular chaperone DjiA [Alphaproteobacteria bacterium]|nr:molecular chaperone DjiA [Alphaproteobacteria bacterium]